MNRKRRPSVDEVLDTAEDAALCDAVFCKFAEHENEVDASTMQEHERVITFVWYSYGLIGNGGFEFLLGANLQGDPGFVLTAAAYRTIGAETAYRCFQEALATFPRGCPQEDLEVRRAHFDAVPAAERERINGAFWGSGDEIQRTLAAYIREHRAEVKAELQRCGRGL